MGKIHTTLCFFVIFLVAIPFGQLKADILKQFFTVNRKPKTVDTQSQQAGFNTKMQVKQKDVLQDYIQFLLNKKSVTHGSHKEQTTTRPDLTSNKMAEMKRQKNLERVRTLMMTRQDSKKSGRNELVFFRHSPRVQLHRTTPRSSLKMVTTLSSANEKQIIEQSSGGRLRPVRLQNDNIRIIGDTTLQPPPVIILKQTTMTPITIMPTKQKTVDILPGQTSVGDVLPNIHLPPFPATKLVTYQKPLTKTLLGITTLGWNVPNTTTQSPATTTSMSVSTMQSTVQSSSTTVRVNLDKTPGKRETTTPLVNLSSAQTTVRETSKLSAVPLSSEQTKDFRTVKAKVAIITHKDNKKVLNLTDSDDDKVKKDLPIPPPIFPDLSKTTESTQADITTIARPLLIASLSTLKDNQTEYLFATTVKYKEGSVVPQINYSESTTNESKILVTDSTIPGLEKLKNPRLWLDLSNQESATDIKQPNKLCSKICTVKNVCKNGATCVNSCDGFTCMCAPGFDGYFCDKVVKV